MHEWLEALRKSAKAAATGVSADEVRWAETECGVPFPEDLGHLYLAFNGGEFLGEVTLFPLHGPEGAASVLEKTRLKLEGLPAAGVWRVGVKGLHRHLFSARKSAMVEQGDGGGPLPGWVEALGDDEWVYGTWDGEKREMRLYRSLRDMLDVLVPPAEVESFGERTFARAMNAVLQGALSGVAGEDEEQADDEEDVLDEAEEEVEQEEAQRELAYEYDEDVSRGRKGTGGDRYVGDEAAGVGRTGAKAGNGKKPVVRVESKVKQTELFVRPTMQEALSKELGSEKTPKKAPTGQVSEPKARKAHKAKTGAVTVAEVAATKEVEPTVVTAASAEATEKASASTKAKKPSAPAQVAEAKPAGKKAEAANAAPAKSVSKRVALVMAVETKPTGKVAAPAKPTGKKSALVKPAASKPTGKNASPAKAGEKKSTGVKAVPAKALKTKSAAKKPAPAKAPAKKGTAKKAAAKKAPAKVATKASAKAVKKAPAQKPTVKAGAKKRPVAKQAVAKKGTAKKAVPSKSAAKKAKPRK